MEEYRVLLATEPSSSPFNVFCCYDKILKDNHKEEGGLFVGFQFWVSERWTSIWPAFGADCHFSFQHPKVERQIDMHRRDHMISIYSKKAKEAPFTSEQPAPVHQLP